MFSFWEQTIFTPLRLKRHKKPQGFGRIKTKTTENSITSDSVVKDVSDLVENPVRSEDTLRKGVIDTENYQFQNLSVQKSHKELSV